MYLVKYNNKHTCCDGDRCRTDEIEAYPALPRINFDYFLLGLCGIALVKHGWWDCGVVMPRKRCLSKGVFNWQTSYIELNVSFLTRTLGVITYPFAV